MNENNSGVIWIIIIIAGIWIWSGYTNINKLEKENANLTEENSSLQYDINDCDMAFDEANNNIEEANSNIDNAKSEAWGNYDDMGNALDDLNVVDAVDKSWINAY